MVLEHWISLTEINIVEDSKMVSFMVTEHSQKKMELKSKDNGIKEKWNDFIYH